MPAFRGLCLLIALAAFFLIAAPLQWLIARIAPAVADRIPIFFCRSLLWLLKVRVTVEDERAIEGPVLLVANHVSWIDILVLGALRPFCFLAKSEVAQWPILSTFAQVQRTIFVDRKRRRTILSANRQMADRLEDGCAVLLFPEGTTVGGPEPGRFHTSHFAAARELIGRPGGDKVSVQPVAIAYSSNWAAWVGDADLVSHVWRTLRSPPLTCALSFGASISYVASSDRKVVAAAARTSIVDMLARSLAKRAACARFDLDRAVAVKV